MSTSLSSGYGNVDVELNISNIFLMQANMYDNVIYTIHKCMIINNRYFSKEQYLKLVLGFHSLKRRCYSLPSSENKEFVAEIRSLELHSTLYTWTCRHGR